MQEYFNKFNILTYASNTSMIDNAISCEII